jgi:small-conductance mechanosensitive channel
MQRISVNFLRTGLFIPMFLAILTGFAAGEEQSANQPAAPEPIPLSEIATQAIKVSDFIRELNKQVKTNQEFNEKAQEMSDDIDRMAKEENATLKILQTNPSLERLQAEGSLWENNKAVMDESLRFLSSRADKYQSILSQLGDLQKIWGLTLDDAAKALVQESIIQQIKEVIQSIETEQEIFQNRQTVVFELQNKAAEKIAQCESMLDQIALLQRAAIGEISGIERRPIWSHDLWTRSTIINSAQLSQIVAYPKSDIELYFFTPNPQILIHFGCFVLLSALFIMIRSKYKQWILDERSLLIKREFDHPCIVSLIVTLFIASGPIFSTSSTVKNLFEVIVLIAIIRLMKPVIDRKIFLVLNVLGFLFALDMVRHAFSSAIFFNQIMLLLEALAGVGVLGWLLMQRNFQPSFIRATGMNRYEVYRAGIIFVMILFTAGLVAGILGYLLAAHFFISTVIIGSALALELFVIIKVLCGVVSYSLRVWPLRYLNMVSRHFNLLERRIFRLLVWVAAGTWVFRVLDYVGLFQPTILQFNNLLEARLQRGSISISLGDVFAFILSVLTAYFLSRFICFVLNEDIYPRTKVSHGISYAMTRLLHYLIMVVGFVVGIGLLGMDLTKVTVLISAFGVGIGFGLQSVVNNFVSGLILLFERPIHADDLIEVGSIQGTVRRIGIRASILQTRQGAEIIIPNSHLVAEQVTNWTFSDQRRRIDLPVGVNYESEPRKVIEVIESVARENPNILNHPLPQVILTGFGDNSINYELRAWTNDYIDWPKVRSDLAVAVYDAIRAAGMSIPFPQREIRMLLEKQS